MAETSAPDQGPKKDTGGGPASQHRRENDAVQQAAEGTPDKRLAGADLDAARNTGALTGGTTPAGAKLFTELGVNPRLDNRTGTQRPLASEWPAKPQQVDGPEVGHFAAHDELARKDHPEWFETEALTPVGTKAEGPHSMGPHGVTVGDEHGQPVDVVGGAGDRDDPRNPA